MIINKGTISKATSIAYNFTQIPSAPEFGLVSASVTIIPSDDFTTGIYWYFTFSASLGNGGRDVILSGSFNDGMQMNNCIGSASKPFRFRNHSALDIIGTSSLFNHSIQTINENTYHEYYGYLPSAPLVLSNAIGGSGNGFQFLSHPAVSGGANFKVQNVVAKSPGASGITFNQGGGGTGFYKNLDISYFRVIGNINGQEGLYGGNTSIGFHYIDTCSVSHFLAKDRGREGFQIGHCNNFSASKGTIYNVGQTGGAGQNNLVQVHDTNGEIEGFIFDGAPNLFNIFTHGFTFRNCTFIWSGSKGFIGASTSSYFSGSARLNGQKVLFDSCTFIRSQSLPGVLTDIAETACDYEFRSCSFSSNITSIYNDIRVGTPTNGLSGSILTNGNITSSLLTSSIYIPVYTNFNPDDYEYHGLCISSYYYNLKQGFRALN